MTLFLRIFIVMTACMKFDLIIVDSYAGSWDCSHRIAALVKIDIINEYSREVKPTGFIDI